MHASRFTPPTLLAVAALALAAVALVSPTFAGTNRQPGAASTPVADSSQAPVHMVSVHGTGRVTVTPDMATVDLGVVERAQTANAAQQAAATAMTAVVESLKKHGIAEADMQTTNVGLGPVYDYNSNNGSQKLIAYEATQTIEVKVRTLSDAGVVVDDAVAAGATQVQSITLSLADPSGPTAQARAAAVADAKGKADALAHASGVTLGGPITIVESSSPVPVPIQYGSGAADAAPAKVITPVVAGTVEVTVDVDISYEID